MFSTPRIDKTNLWPYLLQQKLKFPLILLPQTHLLLSLCLGGHHSGCGILRVRGLTHSRQANYLHFTGEESEAPRNEAACTGSCSLKLVKPVLKPGSLWPKAMYFTRKIHSSS